MPEPGGARKLGPAADGMARSFAERLERHKLDIFQRFQSPGIGFGEHGDDHVRFGLIENEHRTRQAVRGIREMMRRDAKEAE